MNINDSTLARDGLGFRYFAKADGCVYTTEPTGILDADGNMTYEDILQSSNRIDASCALTDTEYKLVDDVVQNERDLESRFTKWMRGLTKNVKNFDGMSNKMFWYNRLTGKTSHASESEKGISPSKAMCKIIETIDILNDFKAQTALESISKACFELHKGPDGVSKTWSEVAIGAAVYLRKE
jgi:hypothetical protein